MGKVYLARPSSGGKQVAVKVISPRLVHSPKMVARFVAEATVLTRISHPNVVQVLDFGHIPDDETMYLVMEWLDGVGLDALLKSRGRFTVVEALPYVQQICAALHSAHGQGVIHRDLKPENIIVLHRHPLTLKVLDFGVAKLLEAGSSEPGLTTVGELVGTPLFMAPEQIEENRQIGPWTDVYALGLVLYCMLGGAHPFAEDELHTVLIHHLLDPPPPLRHAVPVIPDEVAAIVHRCLEKDPDRRPSSAAEVAATFTAAVEAIYPLHLIGSGALEAVDEHDQLKPLRTTTVYHDHDAVYDDDDAEDTVPDAARPTFDDLAGQGFDDNGEDTEPGPRLEFELSQTLLQEVPPGRVQEDEMVPLPRLEEGRDLPPPTHGEPPSLEDPDLPLPGHATRPRRRLWVWLALVLCVVGLSAGIFVALAFC
jgi:serine/threonine protein kinase